MKIIFTPKAGITQRGLNDLQEYQILLILLTGPICFNHGTGILCYSEDGDKYIPIEDVQPGQLVWSYSHGYRRVAVKSSNVITNNPDKWNYCMYRMPKTDKIDNLTDDLIVTGGHSIMVDTIPEHEYELNKKYWGPNIQTIDGKQLLLASVSDRFEKITDNNQYKIYHIALEQDHPKQRFGIKANGVLTELPSVEHLLRYNVYCECFNKLPEIFPNTLAK